MYRNASGTAMLAVDNRPITRFSFLTLRLTGQSTGRIKTASVARPIGRVILSRFKESAAPKSLLCLWQNEQ
jgi:hypothetical protein